jgi:hypothetical protein
MIFAISSHIYAALFMPHFQASRRRRARRDGRWPGTLTA